MQSETGPQKLGKSTDIEAAVSVKENRDLVPAAAAVRRSASGEDTGTYEVVKEMCLAR